jgi:uncharacterized protein with GYD domain
VPLLGSVVARGKDDPVPTYVALLKWTDQGIWNAKESPTRLDERRAAIERAGGRQIGFWWTQGPVAPISERSFAGL